MQSPAEYDELFVYERAGRPPGESPWISISGVGPDVDGRVGWDAVCATLRDFEDARSYPGTALIRSLDF